VTNLPPESEDSTIRRFVWHPALTDQIIAGALLTRETQPPAMVKLARPGWTLGNYPRWPCPSRPDLPLLGQKPLTATAPPTRKKTHTGIIWAV